MKLRTAPYGAILLVLLAGAAAGGASGAGKADTVAAAGSWSRRIADSFLLRHPGAVTYDSGSPNTKWNYEQGLMLTALYETWRHTGDPKYLDFVRRNLEQYVTEEGEIRTYNRTDYNLDNIAPGRAVLALHRETGERRYRAAAEELRRQLREQPRTEEGGFWHKKIYPFQMWLDGLYMAGPFYAACARIFGPAEDLEDVALQFIRMEHHARDTSTGLLYHGWDESRTQRWADPRTGRSPSFWARAMGWYAMGLADALEEFPAGHPRREDLAGILGRLAAAVVRHRDGESGLWHQVMDQGGRDGNYLEVSASCMLAYSFAKGVRLGYLDSAYGEAAQSVFEGVTSRLVTVDGRGLVSLHGTCRSAGLGGSPYRDGSYAYYTGEPTRTNDLKGLGAFLLAAVELERSATGMRAARPLRPRPSD
ncbi:MAG: glycoside hydrolase family 88 protein [Bacteroidota bacterium]